MLIPLTKGYSATIDDEDWDLVRAWKWHAYIAKRNGTTFVYACRCERFAPGAAPTRVFLHRWLMQPPSNMVVDHFDHDTMNYRRENLRVVTHGENNENRKGDLHGWVLHPQIHRKKRYQAKIVRAGKAISLGYYLTADEAERAYNDARMEMPHVPAMVNYG